MTTLPPRDNSRNSWKPYRRPACHGDTSRAYGSRKGTREAALALLDGIDPLGPGWFSDLGRAYAAAGRDADARAEIERLEEFGRRGFGVGYDIALIRMGLREPAGALDALERCIDDYSQLVGFINVEPGFDPIRDDPRFRAVTGAIGLA